MSLLLSISPADLGLPKRFSQYRPGQAEAIDCALSSETQFTGLCAPTGLGKSLIGMTTAQTLGVKAVYLTVTKGLQEQILNDFRPTGLVDVRGRNNYSCRAYTKPATCLKQSRNLTLSCEEGMDRSCRHASTTQCPYYSAYLEACASQLTATNYAYWLHIRRSTPDALGPVELLILDEAHAAFEQLASFLRITLQRDEYNHRPNLVPTGSGYMTDTIGQEWHDFAAKRTESLKQDLAHLTGLHGTLSQARTNDPDAVREIEDVARLIQPILSMDSNWIWETTPDSTTFEPIWVAPYSNLLWSGVPRILLLSATLRPYTLELLGLRPGQYTYLECDNGWPPQNAPIYHLPTVKLNHHSPPEDIAKLIQAIDAIIEARQDRKGLIHSVSYQRMQQIRKLSKYGHRMLANDSPQSAATTVRFFRAAEPPAILLSPSFASGWDFPYRQCEYQILPKVPWLPSTARAVQERMKDNRYRVYMASLEVVQMTGRGRRFSDDRCETFLLDNHFPWLLSQARPYMPRHITVHKIAQIPKRPERCKDPAMKIA